MSKQDKVLTVVFVLFISTIGLGFGTFLHAEKACLQKGWPRARIDFTLNKYCIKRVSQTDVVTLLSKLQEQKDN